MMRLMTLSVVMVTLTACATTDPQAITQPAASQVTPVAGQQGAGTGPAVSGENVNSGDVIDVVTVPSPENKAKTTAKQSDYIICREELILGSHQKKEVCRYKSDIEAVRLATQRELRRASMRPRSYRY